MAKTGHAWLCAPPFRVVDPTIKLQQYFDNAPDLIPSPIFAVSPKNSDVEAWELIEWPAQNSFYEKNGKQPTPEDFPDILAAIKKYGAYIVRTPCVTLKYIFTGIYPDDGPLGMETDLCLSGEHRFELYQDYVRQIKGDSVG